MISDGVTKRAVANVRINSYATYDEDDGIQDVYKRQVVGIAKVNQLLIANAVNIMIGYHARLL